MDLRDHYGIIQCVVQNDSTHFKRLEKIKPESVITIQGKVVKRSLETINKTLPTGQIEIIIDDFEILSEAEELAFASIWRTRLS